MYIWVFLVSIICIYAMYLGIKLDNESKKLDIEENEIKKQFRELLNELK